MNGRAWLFSAATAVLRRPLLAAGEKADADPARRVAIAAIFIIFSCLVCFLVVRITAQQQLNKQEGCLLPWLVRHLHTDFYAEMKRFVFN